MGDHIRVSLVAPNASKFLTYLQKENEALEFKHFYLHAEHFVIN